ncbi:MAG: hypothetical protein ACJA2B_001751 [Candidatus Endobugula sp.]|jgi:hypothetical protein
MYPLNLVVSNDNSFSAAYNASKSSVFMSSQCVTQEKFDSMLEQGAKFDSIVSLEDTGEKSVSQLNATESLDSEVMPRLEQYKVSANKSFDMVITDIHEIIRGNLFDEGMG